MTTDALDQHVVPEVLLHERNADIRSATDAAAAQLLAPDDIMLRYYLVFTDAALVAALGLGHLDDTALFYNRYHWFRRFSMAHRLIAGTSVKSFPRSSLGCGAAGDTVSNAVSKIANEMASFFI